MNPPPASTQARHLIWERLRQLLNQGKTIFLTTHFMDEAERLCHRIAIMDHGRIIAAGAPRELIERHIEPQVVEIYGDGAEGWVTYLGKLTAGAARRRVRPCSAIRTMLLRWCTTSRSGAGCATYIDTRISRMCFSN